VDALGVGWGYATYAVNALARARATRLTKLVHFPRKIKNLLLGLRAGSA
jgi:hypothetical protein